MVSPGFLRSTLTVGLTLAVAAIARGQLNEQNKLLAKRAAEADCYRKLAETIKGIQINSETYVRDFVTESDVIEAELDTFIKGVRLGKPRYYEDGSCEVEAEVTVAKVVEVLKEIHTRHYQGGRIVGTDFNSIERSIRKNVIKAVGMGAPRPDLRPGVPKGAVTTPLPPQPAMPVSLPGVWKTVPPQARLMAARAARMDAQRKLLERILGVRINSHTLVRDFVTEFDETRAEASGLVVGAEEVQTYYHHDELIVEVTMAVPTEQVVRTIKELHTRRYQGDRVTGTDIERVRENIRRKTFESTGAGVPPQKYMPQAVSSTGAVMPDWGASQIKAAGYGTDPNIGTAQGKLKAFRAATSDARRNLIERIHGLQLSSSTYVRDFVTERAEIQSQVQAAIAGSVVLSQKIEGDTATVVIAVGGPEIWSVIHSQMTIESRR